MKSDNYHIKNLIKRYLTAGINADHNIYLLRRLLLIGSLITAIIAIFLAFGIYNFIKGEYLIAFLDLIGLVFSAYAIWQYQHQKNISVSINFTVALVAIFLVVFSYFNQNHGYGLIWTFFFPLIAFMLMGKITGRRIVFIFYAILLPMSFYHVGVWQNGSWGIDSAVRFCVASLGMIYVAYMSEFAMESSYYSLQVSRDREKALAAEREALLLKSIDEKNKLFSNLSHDLRTPLMVLRMQMESIQDGVYEDLSHSCDKSIQKLDQTVTLLDDLMNASKDETDDWTKNRSRFGLDNMIVELVQRYEDTTTIRRLNISFKRDEKVEFVIFADRESLFLAFEKILLNSIKYTDSGGMIVISLTKTENSFVIIFEDSEPGVSRSAQMNLFDSLYRMEESRNRETGGSGLGLSICRNIIDAHKGSIDVDSSSLGGLLVKVSLPVYT